MYNFTVTVNMLTFLSNISVFTFIIIVILYKMDDAQWKIPNKHAEYLIILINIIYNK